MSSGGAKEEMLGEEYQKDELEDIRIITEAGKKVKDVREKIAATLDKLRGSKNFELFQEMSPWTTQLDVALAELRTAVRRERVEIRKYFELISGFQQP